MSNYMSWQNWANVISYVKLHMGATVNNIEFNDEEITDILCEHVLPAYSRFVPLLRYYKVLRPTNMVASNPTSIFEFINFDYKILNIKNVISTQGFNTADALYNQMTAGATSSDVTDYLMNMNIMQMATYVLAPETWRFRPPNSIEVFETVSNHKMGRGFIAELEVVHKTPETIPPDLYRYFLDLSLAEIMILVGNIRSKFENLSTPNGEITIKSSSLIQEGRDLKEKTMNELTSLPPDENQILFLN